MNRMHIPKLLAVVCMAALGASSLHAQKPDTDVQSKAREKLREAMAQLDAQQGAAPAAVTPIKTAVTAAPAATISPAVVTTPSVPAPSRSASDAEMKAREQMRQAAAQLDAQQQTPKVSVAAPAALDKPKPVVKVKAEQKPAKAEVSKTIVYPTVAAPPIAPALAPASKEQRLNELLRLYKADQITPADYHEQRARILGEP